MRGVGVDEKHRLVQLQFGPDSASVGQLQRQTGHEPGIPFKIDQSLGATGRFFFFFDKNIG
jgi:hypothetical protein